VEGREGEGGGWTPTTTCLPSKAMDAAQYGQARALHALRQRGCWGRMLGGAVQRAVRLVHVGRGMREAGDCSRMDESILPKIFGIGRWRWIMRAGPKDGAHFSGMLICAAQYIGSTSSTMVFPDPEPLGREDRDTDRGGPQTGQIKLLLFGN